MPALWARQAGLRGRGGLRRSRRPPGTPSRPSVSPGPGRPLLGTGWTQTHKVGHAQLPGSPFPPSPRIRPLF